MPQENVMEMPLRITFPHLVREPQKLLQRGLGDSQGPADTFGWDTVFAIRASDMNTTLAKPGSSPASFSQNENSTWYGSGNFGPWQVTLGGGAQNLHMSIPITSGSMFYNGDTYPMTNVTATIEVALEYIPQPSSANGTPNNLVTNSQVVSVTDLDFTSNPPPPSAKWMMLGMLSDWFNANLSEFTHVFSTVNLNMTADQSQFQWLQPTDVSYAYVDGADLDSALFAVLCMTENRSGVGLPQELSPNAVPSGQRAGYLVSPGRYLEKLLLPGLPSMFQNATTSDFTVDYSASQVANNTQLSMTSVNIGAGTYTPVIDSGNFTVTINGDELVMNMINVHVPFSPGIDIYLNYTYYAQLVLGTNSQGQQVVLLQQGSQAPVTNHSVDVASWVTWTTVVAGIVAAVISAFVGAGTKAIFQTVAYRVIATIIALLILGVLASIALIMEAVAEGDKDKLPPADLLVTNATNPVTWPGGTGFTLTTAGLNGVFQLGGDPGFGAAAVRAAA